MEIGTERSCNECVVAYREEIIEMVNKITNERFLRRIYIIISDYIKEKPE